MIVTIISTAFNIACIIFIMTLSGKTKNIYKEIIKDLRGEEHSLGGGYWLQPDLTVYYIKKESDGRVSEVKNLGYDYKTLDKEGLLAWTDLMTFAIKTTKPQAPENEELIKILDKIFQNHGIESCPTQKFVAALPDKYAPTIPEDVLKEAFAIQNFLLKICPNSEFIIKPNPLSNELWWLTFKDEFTESPAAILSGLEAWRDSQSLSRKIVVIPELIKNGI